MVALVGRPNVGKSTLFNRLTGTRRALVDATAGTTRDPVEGTVTRGDRPFRLLDTGGLGLPDDRWAGAKPTDQERARSAALVRAVEEEVWIAAGASDTVVLVVDARAGITSLEEEIADRLRRAGVKWTVAANKCDGASAALGAGEFFRLGAPVFPISAAHGKGVDDLLAAVAVDFPPAAEPSGAPLLRVAFAGRPNVGKSSMLNHLLGERRAIVSEIPGTTRDPLEARLATPDGELLLVDTAGLRRGKAREMEAAMRGATARALGSCDVAILLIDASVGLSHDDRRALARALDAGAGVVLGLNKWDLIEDARGDFQGPLKKALGTAAHVPFVACSAATGRGAQDLLAAALAVGKRRAKRMKTGRLQRLLVDVDADLPAGFRPKFLTQVESSPPRFVLFARGRATPGALRRIERAIRDAEDFSGVPLPIEVRRPAERERGQPREK